MMVTKYRYKMQVLQWELFMLCIHFFFFYSVVILVLF